MSRPAREQRAIECPDQTSAFSGRSAANKSDGAFYPVRRGEAERRFCAELIARDSPSARDVNASGKHGRV